MRVYIYIYGKYSLRTASTFAQCPQHLAPLNTPLDLPHQVHPVAPFIPNPLALALPHKKRNFQRWWLLNATNTGT